MSFRGSGIRVACDVSRRSKPGGGVAISDQMHQANRFHLKGDEAGLRAPRTSEGTGKGRGNTRRGMDISFHSLRHTSVSLLKDAGIPDAVVMAMIGHSSASMRHRYTHVGKEALSKAAATLP